MLSNRLYNERQQMEIEKDMLQKAYEEEQFKECRFQPVMVTEPKEKRRSFRKFLHD